MPLPWNSRRWPGGTGRATSRTCACEFSSGGRSVGEESSEEGEVRRTKRTAGGGVYPRGFARFHTELGSAEFRPEHVIVLRHPHQQSAGGEARAERMLLAMIDE